MVLCVRMMLLRVRMPMHMLLLLLLLLLLTPHLIAPTKVSC